VRCYTASESTAIRSNHIWLIASSGLRSRYSHDHVLTSWHTSSPLPTQRGGVPARLPEGRAHTGDSSSRSNSGRRCCNSGSGTGTSFVLNLNLGRPTNPYLTAQIASIANCASRGIRPWKQTKCLVV